MACLSDYEHDVFISYAHLDNQEVDGADGWVSVFHKQLALRLDGRLGETADIWRDPNLDRSQAFDQVIEKAVRSSGVMICLLTPSYLKSANCRQEIEWFLEAAEKTGGLDVGDHRRVLPVRLYNLEPDKWPEPCRGLLGFPFFDPELDGPLSHDERTFSRELTRLAGELHTVLDALGKPSPVPTTTTSPDTFTVFLAAAADDRRSLLLRLRKELERRDDIAVISEIPPPYPDAEHAAEVRKAVERADLCVHLLGSLPGQPLDDDEPDRTYPRVQAELALEGGGDGGGSQLVVMPEGFVVDDVDDPAWADVLRQLDASPRRQDGRLEIARIGDLQLVEVVLDARSRLEAERRSQTSAAAATAYIDLHVDDFPNVTDLVGYLNEKRVTPVTIPSADMNLFAENLARAELFIVVFGAVPHEWVVKRLEHAFKLILPRPLKKHVGVYVAPPEKPSDELVFGGLFEVMHNMDGFHPETVEALLRKATA